MYEDKNPAILTTRKEKGFQRSRETKALATKIVEDKTLENKKKFLSVLGDGHFPIILSYVSLKEIF